MFIYWRVQQDLNCLGEMITFQDPCLARCMRQWVRRNFTGICRAECLGIDNPEKPALN